jgi:hypothetical protein
MAKKKKVKIKGCKIKEHGSSCGGALYFMGFIGSAVYYISNSGTFWEGVVGFLKALVWPAFLVFEALKYLGA